MPRVRVSWAGMGLAAVVVKMVAAQGMVGVHFPVCAASVTSSKQVYLLHPKVILQINNEPVAVIPGPEGAEPPVVITRETIHGQVGCAIVAVATTT